VNTHTGEVLAQPCSDLSAALFHVQDSQLAAVLPLPSQAASTESDAAVTEIAAETGSSVSPASPTASEGSPLFALCTCMCFYTCVTVHVFVHALTFACN
jgi:hypothetical protein